MMRFTRKWQDVLRFLRKNGMIGLVLVSTALIVVACGGETSQIETQTPIATPTAVLSYTDITVDEAKSLTQENTDLVILDVRTKEEFEVSHLHNAILIPVSELANRLNELDKDKKILVYCNTGIRSAIASRILVNNGFNLIYNMLGGIDDWIKAGYPVVSNDEG
jgi:rhodanese-related sulfurtransferase